MTSINVSNSAHSNIQYLSIFFWAFKNQNPLQKIVVLSYQGSDSVYSIVNIWRVHLKSASQEGIDQRQLCFERGLVGVGWQIDYKTVPVTWEEYSTAAEGMYGDVGWKAALNAMKDRIEQNDLIWTRDWHGNYFLGRVTSDWFYETSEDCAKADVVNVRRCEWHEIGTEEAVPGKVVSSFRPPRAVQIIDDNTVSAFSQAIYNQRSITNLYELEPLINSKDIFSLLSTDDCEDAIAIYLQVNHDYLIIPSSCKRDDTMAYEFVLKSRTNGKTAVVQVKSGKTQLNISDYSNIDTDVYLFATSGRYYGDPKQNIRTIDPEEIRKFLYEKTNLLPEKIRVWVELTR